MLGAPFTYSLKTERFRKSVVSVRRPAKRLAGITKMKITTLIT